MSFIKAVEHLKKGKQVELNGHVYELRDGELYCVKHNSKSFLNDFKLILV